VEYIKRNPCFQFLILSSNFLEFDQFCQVKSAMNLPSNNMAFLAIDIGQIRQGSEVSENECWKLHSNWGYTDQKVQGNILIVSSLGCHRVVPAVASTPHRPVALVHQLACRWENGRMIGCSRPAVGCYTPTGRYIHHVREVASDRGFFCS
jgi:hypothetical protein